MLSYFAQGIGFIGMAIFIGSYQCRSSRRLLLVQLVGSMVYAVHFFLLAAYVGAVLQVVTAVNLFILGKGAGRPQSAWNWRGWKWILSLCVVLTSVFTWQGFVDLLPCTSSVVAFFSYWTRNGKRIRIAKLFVSGPFWLIYDLAEHSYAGILTQLICMASISVSIWRYGWRALDQQN